MKYNTLTLSRVSMCVFGAIFLLVIQYVASTSSLYAATFTTTVNQSVAQADPSTTYPVAFTVVFAQAVDPSTFRKGDIVLTGSALNKSVTSITQIAPFNGTTFQVLVNASSSGSITLNIPASSMTAASFAGFHNSAAYDMIFDGNDFLYVADVNNNVVQKFNSAGTLLGSFSVTAPNGYFAKDSANNIYIGQATANNIVRITPAGTSAVFASSGGTYPDAIAVDQANNVYVANYTSNTVSKISSGGSILATYGLAGGSGPKGIVVDASGTIFVANFTSSNITKITSAGTSSIFASVGTNPQGIVMDSQGNLFTSDSNSNRVSKITPAAVVTNFASIGAGGGAIKIDDADNLFVLVGNAVVRITPGGLASSISLPLPQAIAVDSNGNVFSNNSDLVNFSKVTITGIQDPLGNENSAATFTDNQVSVLGSYSVSPSAVSVSENLGTGTIQVVLNKQPPANVVMSVLSSSSTLVTASPSTLTFTSANWNATQTVIVTGVNNSAYFSNFATVTILVATSSSDASYAGLPSVQVPVTIIDDDVPGIVTSPATTSILEAAGTSSLGVRLTSQPASDVVLRVIASSSDVTVSTSTLVFTTSNWNVLQTVGLLSIDNMTVSTKTATIVFSVVATSSDPLYAAVLATSSLVTIINDDVPGYMFSPASTSLAENNGSSTLQIVLTRQPVGSVFFSVSSASTSDVLVNTNSIEFTSINWNVPQNILVTGVDDFVKNVIADKATVTVAVSSTSDSAWLGVLASSSVVSTIDNDVPGFLISPSTALSVTENGGTANFTVTLQTQPLTNVLLTLIVSSTSEVRVSTSTLLFTSLNWNVPQTLSVQGVNDSVVSSRYATVTVSIATSSSDSTYGSVSPQFVPVSLIDDDVTAATVGGSGGIVTPVSVYVAPTVQTAMLPRLVPLGGKLPLIGGGEPNVPPEFSPYVCKRYLRSYIYLHKKNIEEDVRNLQSFLNDFEGESLVVDGMYKEVDMLAVKRFQSKYLDQIITPWGETKPTGNVYRTTVTKINLINCQGIRTTPYFTEYLKEGDVSLEVVKLQDFLNIIFAPISGYPNNGLELTKVFNKKTKQALRDYQTVYKETVLKPWKLTGSTGIFYKTTRKSSNLLTGYDEGEVKLEAQ